MIEWAKTGREILARQTDITPEERALMQSKIADVESTGTLFRRVLVAEAQATKAKLLIVSPTTETSSPEAATDFTQPSETKLSLAEIIPTIYVVTRPIERLKVPSSNQLAESARAEIKSYFGKDLEVPTPPQDLFETLEEFTARGITRFDEVYYQPGLQLKKNDRFWKPRGRVKPEASFWRQIEDGNYPEDVTRLPEGWFIGDKRGKPMYDNGQQRYGTDDYMEALMVALRGASDGIEKYEYVPDYSRAGASPIEIEGKILPAFKEASGAKGNVRGRKYLEFNVRGNIAHPEWGQTNTWEWFADPVFQGGDRLFGGASDSGGLACVGDDSVGRRHRGVSPVVEFLSKPR